VAIVTVEEAAIILGVSLHATPVELATAYRRRARETHPDRRSGLSARDLRAAGLDFIRATEARDVLSAHLDAGGTARPEHPRQRKSPMSFDQFLVWREDAAWEPTPKWDPRADPAPPTTERWPGETFAAASASRALRIFRWALTTLRSLRVRPPSGG
jgi:curved DNA-binding protein CbpA